MMENDTSIRPWKALTFLALVGVYALLVGSCTMAGLALVFV